MREQFAATWTSRDKHVYNYTVVRIDGKVVRVFNNFRHAIQPKSEVFAYFQRTLNNRKNVPAPANQSN